MPDPGRPSRHRLALLLVLTLVCGLLAVVGSGVTAPPAAAVPGDCPAWATDNATECTVSSPVAPGAGPWTFALPLHVTGSGHIDGSAAGIELDVNGAPGLDLVMERGAVIEADDDNVATPNTGASPVTIRVSGNVALAAGSRISADNDIQGGAGGAVVVEVAGDMTMSGTPGTDTCRSFDIPGDGFGFYEYGPFLAPNVYEDPSLGARISSHRWGASAATPGGDVTITVGNYGVPPTGTFTMERCSLVDVSSRGSAGAIEITAGRVADLDGLVLSEGGESGQSPNQPRGGGPITVRAGCELTVSDTGMLSSKGQDPGADLVHLKGCTVTIFGIVQSTTIAGDTIPNQPPNRCNDDTAAHPPGSAAGFSACVRILGQEVVIDATNGHHGTVSVDGVRGNARGWIDVFATQNVTVLGGPGGGPSAISANVCVAGPCSNSTGGVVTVKAINGGVQTSGQSVVQANASAIGSDGGTVTIEAGGLGAAGNVALDGSFVEAKTALAGSNTAGGTIAARSYNGAITSGGSASGHLDASGGAVPGAIGLTECAAVDSYLGTVVPAATETRGACGGQPTVPADAQQLFDENAPIWDACHPTTPATKSGTKFDDTNNNGVRDDGEPGLAGWTIDLFDSADQLVAQTFTDDQGAYAFTIPLPGTFRVCEEQQPGWAQTFPILQSAVPPGEAVVDTCPGPATLGYSFNVVGGETLTGNDFGNFQSKPLGSVTHECAPSGLDVKVTNIGNQVATFSINGTSQSVAPGDSLTVNVAVAEGASVSVTVLMDGSPVAGSPFTFLRDCQHPGASVTHVCAPSGLDVKVTNTGDDSGVFSINGTSQTVLPGSDFTVNVAVAEGASVSVTVLMDGNPVTGSPFTFLRDCQHPGASVTKVCADTGLDVKVTNTGDDSGVFSINGTSQTVLPGSDFTVNVAVAEGASVSVTVLMDGSPVVGSPFTFLRDCQHPGASVTKVCADTGLDVKVTNTGDDSGVFSINGTSQSVAAGDSLTVNVAVAEGASVLVTVLMDGSPVVGSPFTFLRDCQHPGASVTHVCAPSGLDVKVTNTGDDSGVFSINGTSQLVAPLQTFTKNVAVAENASVLVTVLMDGTPVPGSPFTFLRDCQHPAAQVVHQCAETGLLVQVSNTGDDSGVFSINGTSSQPVAPGDSFAVNVAVAEGASVLVTVLMDGVAIPGSPFTFVRDCDNPGASVSHACAASGLDVTVLNTGGVAGTFAINGTSQVVQPGDTFTKNVAVAEGASVLVTVLLDGNPVTGSPFTFLRDCQQPAASVTHVCADTGLDVKVTNTGDDSGTFTINGTSQLVLPGNSFIENVAVAEGAIVQVTVLMDGVDVPGSPFLFARDCEQPEAFAASNCTVDGADVTLTNLGDSPTGLDVAKNSVLIDSVVVPGNDSVVRSYPLGEDEVAVFRVTGPNFDSGDLEVVHDCVQVSAPPTVTREAPPSPPASPPPGTLAFTGASSVPLAVMGGLLTFTGSLAVVGSRRRRVRRVTPSGVGERAAAP